MGGGLTSTRSGTKDSKETGNVKARPLLLVRVDDHAAMEGPIIIPFSHCKEISISFHIYINQGVTRILSASEGQNTICWGRATQIDGQLYPQKPQESRQQSPFHVLHTLRAWR